MPLSDIAISHPCSCLGNSKLSIRSEIRLHRFSIGNVGRAAFPWKATCIAEKVGRHIKLGRDGVVQGRLMIKAAATLEITSLPRANEGVKECRNVLEVDAGLVGSKSPSDFEPKTSSEGSEEFDNGEKVRRVKVSNGNKGNTPWNKGKKHSPETLQLIKERTRLAMQDPKVKMKLLNLGHAQSNETRIKIGMSVRLKWEKRREKKRVQEACHYEWQNLIVGAAQKGLLGEEELQWDSYKILNKEPKKEQSRSVEQRRNTPKKVLNKEPKKERLQSVEQRKTTPEPNRSRRAPKSAEQKRKIAEAIAAKWADPEYRNRVCNGLIKFHSNPDGVERKPRIKPSADSHPRKRSHKKDETTDDNENREAEVQIQRTKSKRSKTPHYKDPLVSSKLERLKSISKDRASAMNKKSVAVARAKLLIAEAEKAAEALETAAAKNYPLAQASLIESRMLISEANQIIESIENEEETIPSGNESNQNPQNPKTLKHVRINGVNSSVSRSFSNDIAMETDENLHQMTSNDSLLKFRPNPNGSSVEGVESQLENLEARKKQVKLTKKWVRGRLVEVAEEI